MSKKFDLKVIAKHVGAVLLLIFFVVVIYIYSWFTGGTLTTVKSCSSSYISGEYDLKTLKQQCPRLSKEHLMRAIEEYFQDNGTRGSTFRETMLQDVNENF